MSTFGKILAWVRDVHTPKRSSRTHALAVSTAALRLPHYYAFYYPKGREPGSGWKYPKAYFGPFATPIAAEEGIKASWPSRAGEARKRFQVKKLTGAQFKKIWGALPEGW